MMESPIPEFLDCSNIYVDLSGLWHRVMWWVGTNISEESDYTVSQSRRLKFKYSPPWKPQMPQVIYRVSTEDSCTQKNIFSDSNFTPLWWLWRDIIVGYGVPKIPTRPWKSKETPPNLNVCWTFSWRSCRIYMIVLWHFLFSFPSRLANYVRSYLHWCWSRFHWCCLVDFHVIALKRSAGCMSLCGFDFAPPEMKCMDFLWPWS
jgi:hypothetical protein